MIPGEGETIIQQQERRRQGLECQPGRSYNSRGEGRDDNSAAQEEEAGSHTERKLNHSTPFIPFLSLFFACLFFLFV